MLYIFQVLANMTIYPFENAPNTTPTRIHRVILYNLLQLLYTRQLNEICQKLKADTENEAANSYSIRRHFSGKPCQSKSK